jgi:hypothetical protein
MAKLRAAGVNVVEVASPDAGAALPASDNTLRQLDLSVTAQGSYAAIKQGLDALLLEYPTLALTYLGLANESRHASNRAPLQAHIRLRFYFAPPT